MLKLVFVALFCAQAFARPNSDWPIESHVVGGTPANEGQFPFSVTLRDVGSSTFFCGGALISDRYVVTAAHCVRGKHPNLVAIGVGSVTWGSQKLYYSDKIVVHQSFNDKNMFNDIGLVRISTAVPLGSNIQPIAYPTNDQLDGKTVTAMGWGKTSDNGPLSPKLLYLNKPVITNEVCKSRTNFDVGPGNICIGCEPNCGMCYGDSGSPLVYKAGDGKNYLAGIVSWGIPCGKGYPDVFTRISYYASWIQQNMS